MSSAASLAVEQRQFCTSASYPCTAAVVLQTSRVWCGVEILDVRTYLVGGCIRDAAHEQLVGESSLLRRSCSRSWVEMDYFKNCLKSVPFGAGVSVCPLRGACSVLLVSLEIFCWGIQYCGSGPSFRVQCYFQSKKNHYSVVADGFLSNQLEHAGQQIPELQVTSRQTSRLEPPSAFCSPDFCVEETSLKCKSRETFCV